MAVGSWGGNGGNEAVIEAAAAEDDDDDVELRTMAERIKCMGVGQGRDDDKTGFTLTRSAGPARVRARSMYALIGGRR